MRPTRTQVIKTFVAAAGSMAFSTIPAEGLNCQVSKGESWSMNPFIPFNRYLDWLGSHDGRLHRRAVGGDETDYDLLFIIPTPPGSTLFTVGDLRALVKAGKEQVSHIDQHP